MTTSTVDRERRRALLRELVASQRLASQSEIVDALAGRGVVATQATVSRDLEELGVVKIRGADGELSYALPETGGLAPLLRQFMVDVAASGNLAVVRTPPGAAGTVASAVDAAELDGVLATVQGDDTVLVVAAESTSGCEVAARLTAIKEGR